MLRQQRELLTTDESNLYRAVEEGKTLSGAEVIYLLEAIKAARACSDEWERQWNDAYEALTMIANMPTTERNPDGVDQAAWSMQLVAQEALR